MFNFLKNKEAKEYEKKYYNKKTTDMLFLIDPVSQRCIGKKIRIDYLASLNLETNELFRKPGILKWLGNLDGRYIFELEPKSPRIYKMRVKKAIEGEGLLLVKVIEKVESNEFLDKIKDDYMKNVVIKNELGKFELRRKYSSFEGNINWLDNECVIGLVTDEEYGETVDKSMTILAKMVSDIKNMDVKLKKYIASNLLEEINKDSDSENVYTEKTLIEDFKVYTIDVGKNGITFTLCGSHGGEAIWVNTTLDGECIDAGLC